MADRRAGHPRPSFDGDAVRFKRHERHEFEDTRLKRLAALRSQQRQRDMLPLLAAIVAETQPDIDTVMQQRAEQWARTEQDLRDRKAAKWREGRRQLDALDPETRRAATAYWNGHRWLPGDPSYLVDMVHGLTVTNRLIVEAGTVRAARSEITRAEVADVPQAHKPLLIPGLSRPKPATNGPKP
jgi:hypothetical protein